VRDELRAPLDALESAAAQLADAAGALEPDRIRAAAGGIHEKAAELHALVENLLCDALLRNGELRLNPQPVDVRDLLQDAAPVVRPVLAQRGQRLHPRISTRVVALADRRRAAQALVNLVHNASRFSAGGAAVEVQATRRAQRVRIAVLDQGPGLPDGLPEGDPSAVFCDAASSGGLGLAVVRAIVEAHGGVAGAEPRPSGGACFWFELPAAR
jgi:K+-sensing histidine kinase KdpD